MQAPLRMLLLIVLSSTTWACSAGDSSTPGKSDGGGGGGSAGSGGKLGSGGKSGSGGAKSTGGGTSSSSSGGSTAAKCATDAEADNCRMCLATHCCDPFTECLGSSLCRSALATHEACFRVPGAVPSACFGDFNRTLQGEAGENAALDPIAACIITNCLQVCGGPIPL